MHRNVRFYPGDLVEVRTPDEILETLDTDGSMDRLPFMPEMIALCGRRFQVSKRVVKTCSSGSGSSTMRGFRTDDVVLLDGLRCSGAEHDGCQKACAIFWREAWLRKVNASEPEANVDQEGRTRLRARLKTSKGPASYFCQASELLNATRHMSRWERLGKCFSEVRAGNCSALTMAQRIGIWLFSKARKKLLGDYARGNNQCTPVESLNLQPGEWVQVKPMAGIVKTLDKKGHNRGLYFSPDMRLVCGEQKRVERRIDKIIVDGTGQMRQLRNTVYLEGSPCGCAHVALGGCSRCEYSYWREIWLQRSADPR
ncbi:MAG: hypothetical protein JO210_03285 [Acidobacteriaceae bacterium]|nr:hypothetical protein [Acidobacteriaceae bacterium]